jgi:NADPH-dependent F420 reductase
MLSKLTKNTRPVIAILGGTGKEGPGLAKRWAIAGYEIIIGSRSEEKAQKTANELSQQLNLDAFRGMNNQEAAQAGDICVLTVIQSAHEEAINSVSSALQGKILVDATARVDFRNPQPPKAPSAARLAQNRLGNRVRVVAAFQNVPAHSLARNLDKSLETDVLVCADDVQAAQEVIHLAEAIGMNAYYAGDLDNAIIIEGLTALLISINKHYGINTASIGVTGVRK